MNVWQKHTGIAFVVAVAAVALTAVEGRTRPVRPRKQSRKAGKKRKSRISWLVRILTTPSPRLSVASPHFVKIYRKKADFAKSFLENEEISLILFFIHHMWRLQRGESI